MQILGITGLVCILSIVGFLLLIRSSGPKPKKALPAKEEIFKNLIGVHGFRRDFVETEDRTLAFFRIQPNNLTVLPESVIEYQIEQMKELLQNNAKPVKPFTLNKGMEGFDAGVIVRIAGIAIA